MLCFYCFESGDQLGIVGYVVGQVGVFIEMQEMWFDVQVYVIIGVQQDGFQYGVGGIFVIGVGYYDDGVVEVDVEFFFYGLYMVQVYVDLFEVVLFQQGQLFV